MFHFHQFPLHKATDLACLAIPMAMSTRLMCVNGRGSMSRVSASCLHSSFRPRAQTTWVGPSQPIPSAKAGRTLAKADAGSRPKSGLRITLKRTHLNTLPHRIYFHFQRSTVIVVMLSIYLRDLPRPQKIPYSSYA